MSAPAAIDDDEKLIDKTEETEVAVVKKTTMEALDHYLLIAILSFLQPEEILACEVQNKRFRLASVCHNSVWLVHCTAVWKKTGFDALWVPLSIPLLERIRGVCTIAQMRKALASYETTALVEKKDFIVLLRAKILFGITACTRGSRGGYVPPVWAGEVFNDGKAAWVFAKKESKRNAALESELLLGGGLWDLTYKNQSEHTFDLQFYSNHEMSSTSHGDQRFHWVLQTAPGFEGVQVENFPLHSFSRGKSGKWQLENDHVLMLQRSGDWDPAQLPLL